MMVPALTGVDVHPGDSKRVVMIHEEGAAALQQEDGRIDEESSWRVSARRTQPKLCDHHWCALTFTPPLA